MGYEFIKMLFMYNTTQGQMGRSSYLEMDLNG
jgi:hypothetical protein